MKKSLLIGAALISCSATQMGASELKSEKSKLSFRRPDSAEQMVKVDSFERGPEHPVFERGPERPVPGMQKWFDSHKMQIEDSLFEQGIEGIIANERFEIWLHTLVKIQKQLAVLSVEQRQIINGYSYSSTDFALALMDKQQLREYKKNLVATQKRAKKVGLNKCCPYLETEEQRTIFVARTGEVLKQINKAIKNYSQDRVEANLKALSNPKMWIGGKLMVEKFKI